SAFTSRRGRPQFSVENAYSVSTSTPRSPNAWMIRRMFSVPARCPAWRESPRSCAQRPLPSMMSATWRGARSRSLPMSERGAGSAITRAPAGSCASDFEQLLLLRLSVPVYLRDEPVRQLLQPVLRAPLVVVRDRLVVLEFAQLVEAVAPHVAHGHARVLDLLVYDLHHLLAPVLGQRRDDQADDVAVVRRVQPQVRLLDRFFDRPELRLVPWLDRDQPRLRRRDRRQLVERRRRPVVLDLQGLDERRPRPPRPHRVQLPVERAHRALHAMLGVAQRVIDHPASLRPARSWYLTPSPAEMPPVHRPL